ncbi:MAG: shikimate kinase [Pseudomonadota bacterium]|nr:shikimate kinase [Pseudomonadota bacterium]|tara:strand:- start:1142 stop:1663 length:522 start_codon:yes stop_codon:yes gene_type:complete
MPNNNFNKITLTGMMGSGKTSIGKLLAKKISLPFYDSDKRIESKLNLKISDIFSEFGEKRFRQEEELICKELLEKKKFILALGGGAILNKEIHNLMLDKTLSIWIKTNMDVLFNRLKNDRSRPLLNGVDLKKEIKKISSDREQFYSKSDICIENNDDDLGEVVEKIISRINKV